MNENKGAKGGSRDRRILKFFLHLLNIKFSKASDEEEKSKEEDKKKKELEIVSINIKDNEKVESINNNKNVEEKNSNSINEEIRMDNAKKQHNNEGFKVKPIAPIVVSKKEKTTIDKNIQNDTEKNNDISNIEDKGNDIVESTKKENESSVREEFINIENDNTPPKFIATYKKPVASIDKQDTVDLDPEPNEKETVLEKKIVEELETIIEDNRYRLESLVIEYNLLNKEADELINLDNADEALKEIEDLLLKLETIKKELDTLISSNNLENVYQLDQEYLSYLLNIYRNNFVNDFTKNKVEELKTNKDYTSIIIKIDKLENDVSRLEEKVSEKVYEFDYRDKSLFKMKDSLNDVDSSIRQINYIMDSLEITIRDIENKVKDCVKITEKVEYIQKEINHQLGNLLFIFALTKRNPLIPASIALLLRSNAILKYINALFNPEYEKKVSKKIEVIDYEQEIRDALNDVNNLDNILNSSLETIKNIKKELTNKFSEYIDTLPECKIVTQKLNKLENEIKDRAKQIKDNSNNLDFQLSTNKQKMMTRDYNN